MYLAQKTLNYILRGDDEGQSCRLMRLPRHRLKDSLLTSFKEWERFKEKTVALIGWAKIISRKTGRLMGYTGGAV